MHPDLRIGVGVPERLIASMPDLPDKYRILFVTQDKFPPFRPAAKAIFSGEMTRQGHEIDWLIQAESAAGPIGATPFGNGVAYVARSNNGTSRWQRLKKYWWDFKNDFQVFQLARTGNYTLIQVKDRYLSALLALWAARRAKIPLYYWLAYPHPEAAIYASQENIARFRYLYWIRGQIQRWLLYRVIMPGSRHVFVQSEQMRLDIQAEGIPRDHMTSVPSSVDLSEIDDRMKSAVSTKPTGESWIVYLGTLIRERRLEFLVRVLAKIREQNSSVRLMLIGSGENPEDESQIHEEATRLSVSDAVTVTGWLPMDEAWGLVQQADICLSPYFPTPILNSTSPTKLIEYMALGKATVANDHPEQSLVVDESGCGICCSWDEEAFASAILELLSDPARREAMGRAGRAYVEEYRTHSTLTARVLEVYGKTLNLDIGG